jgi:hypothetical protein
MVAVRDNQAFLASIHEHGMATATTGSVNIRLPSARQRCISRAATRTGRVVTVSSNINANIQPQQQQQARATQHQQAKQQYQQQYPQYPHKHQQQQHPLHHNNNNTNTSRQYDVYDCVTETPTTTRTSTNKSTTFPAEHMEVQYTEAAATSTEVVNHRNSPSTDALRSSSHHRRDDLDHWSVTSGSTQVQFHFSQLDVSRLQKTADEPLTFIPIPVAIR